MRFHWHIVNSTPCLNWPERRMETHYLQKRHAAPGVSTAPRVKLPRCHEVVIQYGVWIQQSSIYKQSQTRKINCGAAVLSCHDILKHSTRTKRRLWRLRPVSHGAYCRSTSASPHPRLATSTKVLLLLGCLVPLSHLRFPSRPFRLRPSPHKSPCRLSYLLMMFLQRPSSFLMSATSWRRAAFSRSRKAARTEIWFSFSRRASRERFAASLFFTRRLQYFSSWRRRRCGMLGCVGRKVEGGEKKKKQKRRE